MNVQIKSCVHILAYLLINTFFIACDDVRAPNWYQFYNMYWVFDETKITSTRKKNVKN